MQIQYSPMITKMRWGSITVQRMAQDGTIVPDELVTYRDAKLWPGGSSGWNWRDTGTNHIVGIQIFDLSDLMEHNPQTIILSRGVLSLLKVPGQTVQHILDSNPSIDVIVLTSRKAFSTYNDLAKVGNRVAALIHTTC